MGDGKRRVLMVCLGNSCRSPIAEAVFQNVVNKAGVSSEWEVDSAALMDWNVGLGAEPRSLKTMSDHGLTCTHKARQITKEDFEKFDYIFGMDMGNVRDLNELKPANSKAKILLLGDFDPQGEKHIRDPYFDYGSEGFEKCYQQCSRMCPEFFKRVTENNI
ncbi:unnamed protein product [Hermetia illucens]|uniref:Low molecular weight phosphotyrosine protein phosphatase n=1 Tax=Hermetia illucens TaxID=343691 RepID=A0A7R8UTP0_HERIL|nr:low molecular weight phosphotyrosine protein phosphatase 1-like [Hermetia illucens]CAD7086879.1 unnamed protein product [Hermetia illucens]